MKVSVVAALVAAIAIPSFASASGKYTTAKKDIVTIAVENGSFKTLVAAVGCADASVATALTSGDKYTVFAPTDTGFAKLGLNAGNICSALDKATLTNVLLYHVSEGRQKSNRVLPRWEGRLRSIDTLLQKPFYVTSAGQIIDTDKSSNPYIITAGILASNGVIHVIGDVILPIEI